MNPTPSQYDTQAADFLARFGIKCRITLAPWKAPLWPDFDKDSGPRNRYRVTLSKKGEITRGRHGHPKPSRLAFDFWGSINDAKKLATAQPALDNMRLQITNTEPHLRLNLADMLAECEAAVSAAHPSAYDVLACISGDAHTPGTFAEYVAEYGGNADSIKERATWKRCDLFARRLRAFFTAAELDALAEIQ